MNKTLYTLRQRIFLSTLNEARRGAGVTQIELADYVGMSQSDVSKVERGVRRLDVAELFSWLEALGLSPGPFIEAVEERIRHAENLHLHWRQPKRRR
jgi:transcriptional regulator with XRE-family HTH domain